MSKNFNHNTQYNKFAGNREPVNPVEPEVTPEVVEEPTPEVEETATAEPVTTPEPTPVVEETKPVIGMVNGVKLNVRKFPNKNSEALTVLRPDAKVKIDLEKSTVEWYKVITDKFEGYCMKQFITVLQ